MSDFQNTAEIDKRFHEEYTVGMIKHGRATTLIAAILTFLPALYLWFGMGIKPEWSMIGQGWAIILSSYFIIYLVEPLGYYPVLGLSGIYLGYLAGNIPSVRLPALLSAQAATGCEAGTKKGELVGTIAMGVSVFVNLAFVSLAAVTGVAILAVLPPFIVGAFDYTLPAILGGVMAQYFMNKDNRIFVPLIIVVCIAIQLAPLPNIVKFPGALFMSFVIGYFMYKAKKKKA